MFNHYAQKYPDRMIFWRGYNNSMAHKIEAGADFFLMPSRYEPCGLNQMYSLRYGTVPVVRATGGLDDTVRDPEEDAENPNGFKFRRPWGTDLVAAIGRAVATYRDRSRWEWMVRTGMAEDSSWRRSAGRYGELYLRLKGEGIGAAR